MISVVAAVLELLIGVLVALSAGWRWPTRGVTILFMALALFVPCLVGRPDPVGSFLIGVLGVIVVMRGVDLLQAPVPFNFPQRLWHVLAIFDRRAARACPPHLNAPVLKRVTVSIFLGTLALLLGIFGPLFVERPWGVVLRCAAGAAFSLTLFEVVMGTLRVSYEAFGIRPPPLHDRPHLARSVGEFWAHRWNRIFGGWLRSTIYVPLMRVKRPRLAVVGTFVFSALIHAYLVAAPLGWLAVVSVIAFFVLQGLIVLAEHALRVQRWRPLFARIWTVGLMLATTPLFLLPMWSLLRL